MSWELLPGWRWTPVSDVLFRVKAQVQPDAIQDDWLYIGLEHVQSASGMYTGVEAITAGIRSAKFQFEGGDILYGKLRPNLRKCVVTAQSGVCSTDLVPLRPTDPEAAHFVALQLRSGAFTSEVMKMIGGANLPRVNMKDFFTLSVPTPPADEASRLYTLARSVAQFRERQRTLKEAVDVAEASATAVALGMSPVSARALKAVLQPPS